MQQFYSRFTDILHCNVVITLFSSNLLNALKMASLVFCCRLSITILRTDLLKCSITYTWPDLVIVS